MRARAPRTPHVSIVTPFFNNGPEFAATAASVIGQSFQPWEWIIVNDGSDILESTAVLAAYRDGDPRIRVVDHPVNRGLSAARNTGVHHTRADLVLQLDDNILLEPTAVEKWYWYLAAHPEHSFVTAYTVVFGARQHLWNRSFQMGRAFKPPNEFEATTMFRRKMHASVGGFDEIPPEDLANWSFLRRCTNAGYLGGTVREYLSWFRYPAGHAEPQESDDYEARRRRFPLRLRRGFSALLEGRFPRSPRISNEVPEDTPEPWPSANVLHKRKPRLLLVVPWLAMGGTEKFTIDLLGELTGRGWEITVATTREHADEWMPLFAAHTPDVFALHRFLRPADYPRFLSYLIRSRRVDTVMIVHSELGYRLLPYLRSQFPEVTFVDSLHVVEPAWNDGGFPRFAVRYAEQLDLSIAASEQVKRWMVEQGADPLRVEICHINVNTHVIRPDAAIRAEVRREHAVAIDTPIILFAGRVCQQKQPFVLADTVARLRRRSLEFEVWVAGDGPDLDHLRSALGSIGFGTRFASWDPFRRQK
ncbi:MAG: glycosyltransferase [Gemmatimonadaceae bacterium]|nr:glycosyltransferase [Gemmatimonadaceae bacterium]